MADEVARRDDTGIPTLLGVGETSGEIRRILSTELGELKTAATVSLSAATSDLTIHGSPDGGITRPIVKTDAVGNAQAAGDVAHDDPDSGYPVKVGGTVAQDQVPPAVSANGDRTQVYATDIGALNVAPSVPGASETKIAGATAIGGTPAQIIASPGPSVRLRLLSISIWNKGTSPSFVQFYFDLPGNMGGFGDISYLASVFDRKPRRITWPDGAGPVGAVSKPLSFRAEAPGTGSDLTCAAVYREEVV